MHVALQTTNYFKNPAATCGDTNGDEDGIVPFPDEECRNIAPWFYYDSTDVARASILIGGFSSVLNAAYACCKV